MKFAGRLLCLLLIAAPSLLAAAEEVKPTELRKWQEEGKTFLLLDVRSEVDHKRGHIEGSISMPLPRLKHQALSAAFPVVIVDDDLSGKTAKRGAGIAEESTGETYILKGGYTAWKRAALPTAQEESFSTSPAATKVTAEDLQDVIEKNGGKSAAGSAVVVLELRSKSAPKSAAVIPGAVVITSVEDGLKLAKSAPENSTIVLADDGSGQAMRKVGDLAAQGLDARVLAGGTHAWKLMKAKQEAEAKEALNKQASSGKH
jgi:rhodanese-related sulfurtransferase